MTNFSERFLKIFLDVVTQRLERRDIKDVSVVIEFSIESLFEELIDAGEKGREGLAGASRCGNQRIRSGLDRRPGLLLHLGWSTNLRSKPLSNERMKSRERHGAASYHSNMTDSICS